ncbi:hypothetical protein ACINJI_004530 [Cronobacter dublinensis]
MYMVNTSRGAAKVGFVGTNANRHITTIHTNHTNHTKSSKDIWKTLNGDAKDTTIRIVPKDETDYKMKYYAKVIGVNNDVDEEVLLCFGEVSICCFIAHCPYEIIKGNIYLVEVELSFLDDETIETQPKGDLSITRQGDTFGYEIRGFKIDDKVFANGIVFSDEIYNQEFAYINHEYVLIKPDRVSVSFL